MDCRAHMPVLQLTAAPTPPVVPCCTVPRQATSCCCWMKPAAAPTQHEIHANLARVNHISICRQGLSMKVESGSSQQSCRSKPCCSKVHACGDSNSCRMLNHASCHPAVPTALTSDQQGDIVGGVVLVAKQSIELGISIDRQGALQRRVDHHRGLQGSKTRRGERKGGNLQAGGRGAGEGRPQADGLRASRARLAQYANCC